MFRSIIIGTDGSETATTALRQAIDLARELGARLDIVSAYVPVSNARLREEKADTPRDLQWAINPREEVQGVLDDARAEAERAGVNEVDTVAREGDPADTILDVAAERGSDLIIVGNRGMTGSRRFMVGSVPNKISHHAPCSVLIVRTT